MLKTAEAVSVGHPDKTADYISSYILDHLIAQDPFVRYAVEVMVKDQTIVLGGEISGKIQQHDYEVYVKQALRNIGYDEKYAAVWGDQAININKITVIDLIGKQSAEIYQGVESGGWGDQGVYVGYACQQEGYIPQELYLAQKLNRALYEKARREDVLGIDIKTQITVDNGQVITAIAAVPMREKVDLSAYIEDVLGQKPQQIIVNAAGDYKQHSSVADCGVTGRKLACDFYETASPIGGGSPWTKDPSKADLTLNLYARQLAVENLADYDEVWVYLSSCIGRVCLPSATLKWRRGELYGEKKLPDLLPPNELIEVMNLRRPIYADLCLRGLIGVRDEF